MELFYDSTKFCSQLLLKAISLYVSYKAILTAALFNYSYRAFSLRTLLELKSVFARVLCSFQSSGKITSSTFKILHRILRRLYTLACKFILKYCFDLIKIRLKRMLPILST